MRLIGSRTEKQMREELIRSNLSLRHRRNERLARSIESMNAVVDNAYVLHWIPEQMEDIYEILVSAHEVLTIEVPRGAGEVLVERRELSEYMRGVSKVHRIRIAVALDLLGAMPEGG